VKNANGQVRIVSAPSDCLPSESATSWNVVGPVGPVGPQGSQGPQGLQGPQGAAGTNGTNGTNGTDGVSGYQEVENKGSFTFQNGASPSLTVGVSCPAGHKVLGGGGFATVNQVLVSLGTSTPNGQANETPDTGWRVGFVKSDGSDFQNGDTLSYDLFAICADVG
jgi:hypothetical protein